MRALVVDDDAETAEALAKGLAGEGIEAITVRTGRAALDSHVGVDVVLLDIRLPDLDGFEVCRAIRTTSSVPIIILSARDTELDRVLGLKLGADDYVVKPYGLRELTARIEASVRRATNYAQAEPAKEIRSFGPVQVDLYQRKVTVHDREVAFTRKEFDLLALLSGRPGMVFTREVIMREVWGYNVSGDTRTLGVHITHLRKKLQIPQLIETVRGIGFRLVP
jgi:DNA-binding response OmpR family regulator